MKPKHMDAEEARPTPGAQRAGAKLFASPSLAIVFTSLGCVAFCLLGTLLVVGEILVILQALEHAFRLSWNLFVTLRSRVFAAPC
jgi:hypothetical protein